MRTAHGPNLPTQRRDDPLLGVLQLIERQGLWVVVAIREAVNKTMLDNGSVRMLMMMPLGV